MYAPINNRHNIQKRLRNVYVAGRAAYGGRATCGESSGLSIAEVVKLYSVLLLLWRPDINPVWAPWPKDNYLYNYSYERYIDNILMRPSLKYWGDYTGE